jgi:ABC-type Fe3+ transport system substrate-binding protein
MVMTVVLVVGLAFGHGIEEAKPAQVAGTQPFEAKWKELVSKAKGEGELVIIMGGTDSASARGILQWFQNKYGVKIIASTGSGSKNADRLLAERTRGRHTVDVSMVGGSSTERLRKAGALMPVEPLIVDPTILHRNSEQWLLADKVYWTDRDKKYSMATSLRVSNLWDIFYNTKLLSRDQAAGIKSYKDLFRPEFRGKIAATGQASLGGGVTTRTRLWLTLGEEFFRRLYLESKMQVVGADNDRELAEGLARGKWAIALGAGAEQQKLANLGLPVASITDDVVMEEGLVTEVRGTLSAVDQGPHPHAQRLFVNWWYSQEGMEIQQTLTHDPTPTPVLRRDVSQGKVPDREWKRIQQIPRLAAAGKIKILDQASPEWVKAEEESLVVLRKIYDQLGYPY